MSERPGLPFNDSSAVERAEDTVELELSADEQMELSRAAEASQPLPPAEEPAKAAYDTLICARTRRADVAGTVTFALLVCAVTAAAGWHALVKPAPEQRIAAAPLAPALVTANARPERPTVQVVNPFDVTEVFEVPSEFSESEVRDAVAALLLERARERRLQGLDLRRVSHAHPHSVPTIKPTDIFVTKVLLPLSRFADAPPARIGTRTVE